MGFGSAEPNLFHCCVIGLRGLQIKLEGVCHEDWGSG